jgi:dGTPase
MQNPGSLDDVRNAPPLIAFSAGIYEQQRELKIFLRDHLYRHYRVLRMSAKAQRIVGDLFGVFMADRRLLPPQFQQRGGNGEAVGHPAASSLRGLRDGHDDAVSARAVADYVAGMTDRYAIREHRRIFAVEELPISL